MPELTRKLYLENSYQREFDADVLESSDGWSALSQTVFYPGGGGQPPDRGHLSVGGETITVSAIREDTGQIWHCVKCHLPAAAAVHGTIDWPFRYMLMRHHGLMHIVNAVAGRQFGAMITGVQLGPVRSRIDFKLGEFSRDRVPNFEKLVNDVIDRCLSIRSSIIGEEEYRRRPELIRTLNVLPPVIDGMVRIVQIEGFDAQACGATHVHSTGEIGRAHIARFENKGKDNKRFYWNLVT